MTQLGPILSRLRTHALERPNAPALEVGGELRSTYGQLWEAVRRVGRALHARELAPEAIVGLALPRGPEFVVALLGCWWAGLAFCPLDPEGSPIRRARLVKRAGIDLVLEDLEQLDAPHEREVEAPAFDPHRLAYLIFTSGSTGRPKGVLVEHAGLEQLTRAQVEAFRLGPQSRVWWLLSPLFDASLSDISTALVAGACLCTEDTAPLADPRLFLERVAERGYTHIDLPPALLALLDSTQAPRCLETLVIGGEVARAEVVEAWARCCRVVNVYGPTEATICTSLNLGHERGWAEGSLGRPIEGIRYTRDEETGELIIAGEAVARGYLDEAGELAARFFVDAQGARAYRSGDRVCPGADGNYRFTGRIDRQLKINGRLISPEEVEAALGSHPKCPRAHVFGRQEGQRTRLHAAVEAPASVEHELRAHLETRVPAWLQPQHFHFFEALPLGASGKPDAQAIERACTHSGQEGPHSSSLAALLARILGVHKVDPEASFEALGMTSLDRVEFLAAATPWGVSASLLANATSLHSLEEGLREGVDGEERSSEELLADVESGLASIELEAQGPPQPPKRILLTGATGFLGGELLGQLSAGGYEVHCLVRGGNAQHAHARLRERLQADALPPGVAVHLGDLAEPRLGLQDGDYDRLAQQIDTVVHCGAQLSWTQSYEALRTVNLLGTRRVLEFAHHGRAKALHHMSTLAVFAISDLDAGEYDESIPLTRATTLFGGYAQSKWAAEAFLRRGWASPAPLAVYRLGLLTGHSESGVGPGEDALALLTKGLGSLGAVPELEERDHRLAFDYTPVDFAAKTIASLLPRASGTFNVAGQGRVTLRQLLQAMRDAGVPLESVDRRRWLQLAQAADDSTVSAAQLTLTRLFEGDEGSRPRRAHDLFLATHNRFSMQRALELLGPDAPDYPAPTPDRLHAFVRYHLGVRG